MSSIKVVRFGDEPPITPDPLRAILKEAAENKKAETNGAPKKKPAWPHQEVWDALYRGNFSKYQGLKARGARFDWVSDHGEHPLHVAALGGNVAIIEDLVKSGHDMNVVNEETEMTPVQYALVTLHADAVRFFAKNGAKMPENFQSLLHDKAMCLHPPPCFCVYM